MNTPAFLRPDVVREITGIAALDPEDRQQAGASYTVHLKNGDAIKVTSGWLRANHPKEGDLMITFRHLGDHQHFTMTKEQFHRETSVAERLVRDLINGLTIRALLKALWLRFWGAVPHESQA
jgi:hypothetical protein